MRKDPRPFITVHDGMPDHPKIERLSDAAFRLLVTTWCWCNKNKTDGRVPAASWGKRGTPKTRRELVDAGLAEPTGDGVQMHDYLDHQRSAAEIDDLSEKRRAAGSKGGKTKAKNLANAKASATDGDRSRFGNGDDNSTSNHRSGSADRSPSQPSKSGETPLANARGVAKQTASKNVAEQKLTTSNSTTAVGLRNVPPGAAARIVRAYVETARASGMPCPTDQQAKVQRSAERLLAEPFPEAAITEAARNAAAAGWTDLATQLQRDAARASPNGARPSTTDRAFRDALDLAARLEHPNRTDRRAIG